MSIIFRAVKKYLNGKENAVSKKRLAAEFLYRF